MMTDANGLFRHRTRTMGNVVLVSGRATSFNKPQARDMVKDVLMRCCRYLFDPIVS